AQGARGGAADEGAGAGGHGGATCADLGAAGDDLGQFVAGQADGDGFGDGHGVLSFLCGVMGSLPNRWMQCAGGGGREWVWQACQCGGGRCGREAARQDGYWLGSVERSRSKPSRTCLNPLRSGEVLRTEFATAVAQQIES